ncbi:alternate-type signal peptide domain-containing protein [Aeromicrobium sp. zg-629]|nr:alternate-type signal peptide domain-containing protein [Aeromicrobium senzhongii]
MVDQPFMREKKMNKSTKGAVAAGAAAVLLLGGAGSLAYWNAEGDITGGTITAGELKLTAPTTSQWTLNGTTVANPAAVLIVPGDELKYTGSWTVKATGQNIKALVDFDGLAETPSIADKITVTDTYTLGTTALAEGDELTVADNGKVLTATVLVDLPFGTVVDNASQAMTVNLTAGKVTLTQKDATPAVA